MVQTVQIELSMNRDITRSQIWINAYITGHLPDLFYDSKTQFIQFTAWEVVQKVLWTIYRPNKKSKNSKYGNELSIKGNIKALKYISCLSFRTCQKKIVEFADSLIQFTDQQI